jgi:hypothetical protein
MLREVKFFMEGFEITKEYAIELLKKYAEEEETEFEDAVDEISRDGEILFNNGILSIVIEVDGCPEELIDEIFYM